MIPSRTVIGYVRVSTLDQAEHGVSVEAQHERIRAWAASRAWPVAAIFTDAGLSGSRADNRPALRQAIQQTCEQKACLVVYSLSRLARSTVDTINLTIQLEKAGADLVSLSESIDTSTAAGKMLFRMMAILAEFERDVIAERTKLAMSHKKQRGEYTGGNCPYGKRVGAGGILENDPAEHRIISQILYLKTQMYSYSQISAYLNIEQLYRRGSLWNVQAIYRIVKSFGARRAADLPAPEPITLPAATPAGLLF